MFQAGNITRTSPASTVSAQGERVWDGQLAGLATGRRANGNGWDWRGGRGQAMAGLIQAIVELGFIDVRESCV